MVLIDSLGLRWLLSSTAPKPKRQGRHRATPGDSTPETAPAEYLYPRVRVKRVPQHRWED